MNRELRRYAELEERFEKFMNSLEDPFWTRYFSSQRNRFWTMTKAIPVSADPVKILDIGTTEFTFFLKSVYPHYEICTVDLTDASRERCEKMGIQFKRCNLEEEHLPFHNTYFDLVLFCEVLEHLFVPPTEILGEIRRTIRPNGRLIISVPNIAWLMNRVRLMFGASPLENPDTQMRKPFHGHIHEYTLKELTILLLNCNFTVLNAQHITDFDRQAIGMRRLINLFSQNALMRCVPSFRRTVFIECCIRMSV